MHNIDQFFSKSEDMFIFNINSQIFPEKLRVMLVTLLTSALLLGSRLAAGQQEDCTAFKEGACPLEESNIIGNSGEATNAAECQVRISYISARQKFEEKSSIPISVQSV